LDAHAQPFRIEISSGIRAFHRRSRSVVPGIDLDPALLHQAGTYTTGSKPLRIKNVLQLHGDIKKEKRKPPGLFGAGGLLGCKSLTMTYFHTGTRTIIGAKSFHCPVRDG